MSGSHLFFFALLAAWGGERLFEVWLSRRNARRAFAPDMNPSQPDLLDDAAAPRLEAWEPARWPVAAGPATSSKAREPTLPPLNRCVPV